MVDLSINGILSDLSHLLFVILMVSSIILAVYFCICLIGAIWMLHKEAQMGAINTENSHSYWAHSLSHTDRGI
jgi:hypothetical protein